MKKIFAFSIVFLMIQAVYSINIETSYLKDNTMELEPGESTLFLINVINKAHNNLLIETISESHLAEISSDRMFVLEGYNDNRFIKLKVNAPEDALTGDEYIVKYSIKESPQYEEFSESEFIHQRQFIVKINQPEAKIQVEEPQENRNFIAFVFLAIIFFVAGVMYKRKLIVGDILNLKVEDDEKEEEEYLLPETKKEKFDHEMEDYIEERKVISYKEEIGETENIEIDTDHPKITEEQYFSPLQGEKITSVEDLANKLVDMPDEIFEHHVTVDRNDFSNWIRGVFKDEDLADKIIGKSKTEMIEILKEIN